MALTKLTKNLIDGTFGTEWVSTIQTSNFTAEAAKGYFVNTTAGTITINLPAGVVGTEIVIQDYAGTFAANKIILFSNGSEKIQGSTDDFKCTINNATVTLIYQDATKGWTADNISTNNIPLTISYLVVAGGGAGVNNQGGGVGGGGAGGYLTNYGGTALTLAIATNYIVTVGAGGAANVTGGSETDGSNSVFNTITSIGGGKGGYGTGQGNTGGSGGGSGRNYTSAGGLGTSGQGNDGGAGGTIGAGSTGSGGGGGGAGSVGVAGVSPNNGGNGGDGLENQITGATGVFYAGGGGGGSSYGGGGSGGSSIGGNGGLSTTTSATAGSTNTGSGGGGAGGAIQAGSGGSGIVILRYPSDYTVSGLSGTTTTVGTDSVTTFTSGTGNIQFN